MNNGKNEASGLGVYNTYYPKPESSIFAPLRGVKSIFAPIFARGQKWGKNFCPYWKMVSKNSAKIGKIFRILGGGAFNII